MIHVGDLLSDLSLPAVGGVDGANPCHPDWMHDLGADLPAGHLHLWGGPQGAGKTSFLLSLLYGAALRGRRVLYATYHLPASSLALRLLAMAATLDVEALANGRLDDENARRAARMRRCLASLPLFIIEARGLTTASIQDRLMRMPFRAEVLAVDYLQGVIRAPGEEIGTCVRAFSDLAQRLHIAIVVALQPTREAPADVCRLADRAGWITPAGEEGLRTAEVIRNRYGGVSAVGLRLDAASGALERVRPPED